MAQIVGRKRPVVKHTLAPAGHEYFDVTVERIDHQNNAGLAVTTYTGTQKKIIDEAAAPGTIYIGYAFPGTATDAALWQIQRVTVAGAVTTIEWAEIPLVPGPPAEPARFATFEHIWDDRAALAYG